MLRLLLVVEEEEAHSGSGLLVFLVLEGREDGSADGLCCMGLNNCDNELVL